MRKGWEYKKLGEVTSFFRGLTYSGKDEVDYSNNVVLRSNNIDLSTNSLNFDELKFISDSITIPQDKKLRKNSIFMCMSNGSKQHLGKVAFIEKEYPYAFGGFMGLIVPNEDRLVPKFTYYYFCSQKFKAYLSAIGNGANINNIKYIDIAKDSIPLPPQSTQLAIVSELDKINELIRLKKEQLKDFGNLAQSLFYEMFGDPVENEKGWEVKKLKDISREIGDGLHGTPEYSEVDTGCYFINGNNLENGTIVIKENTKMVSEKTKAKHYIEMDDFTILVSINGTLGKVAFYNGENVILGKSACYIKLEAYNDKKYIFELLKSDYFKRYAESECTGTTIRNVSLKSMRNFRCPLPPLPLQRLFAQRIEQIEREKSEVQKSIQDLETLLASRMQYWFE
mgnify:CR=1 FL=1